MRGISKIGAATLAGLVSLLGAQVADALVNDVNTSYTQPSNTLVMPFDVTEGKQSYAIVSNTAGTSPAGGIEILAVSTHWTFWSDSCDYLGDAWACLTLNDTVVVDPRAVASVDANNATTGDPLDLSGNRGMVVVTAYVTDQTCAGGAVSDYTMADDAIVGTYTMADISSNAAFGGDAVGLGLNGEGEPQLPQGLVDQLDVQTFNPTTLGASSVVFLSVTEMAGEGATATEIGPNSATLNSALTFYDEEEIGNTLPDAGVKCATFASMIPGGGLIPSAGAVNSSGFLRVKYSDGTIGGGTGNFVYGLHGQAVGQFGGSSSFKYTVNLIE